MGKINIVLSDEFEHQFRQTVFKVKGMKKGNISEAIQDAIKEWMEKHG